MSNYITIKLRRGTQAQWATTNPVLAEGEFGAETDTRKFKIGNGVTAWNSLSYWGSAGGGAADFTDLGDVPASYTGQGGKFVKVKSTEDGLEFGTLTIAAADLPSGIDAAKIANGSVSNTEFQYLDGATSNIQTQINNRVPYVGASGDVNLGEWGIQLGNLEFDNTPTNTPATDGSVFWDDGDGTLQLQMKGGSVQKVGMQTFARVYNDSGVQLVKGDVVYISGAQGNRIAAKKAQANSETTSKGTIGFCVETIAAGAEGVVITEGPLYKLNTNGLTAGQTLYLSATTAGAYTTTAPQAPDHIVILGTVERVSATVGSIYVKVDNGYELEELHDVDLTESKATPVDADALLIQDSADVSIWKRLTWANLKATAKAYFDTLYAAVVHTHVIGDVTNLQTTLDGKVDENAPITGATKTKISYDAKGLVTAGADATTADIADSTNKRYVTDAQLTVIGNTSGTNTGDQNLFGKVAVSGQSDVVADSTNDTLTLVAGSNITITTDATTDSITIASTGGGGGVSDGDKGDITVSSSGATWTIDNDAVTYAKMQNVSATNRFLGRITSGAGDIEELTGTQATTLLDTFTSSLKGLAPASGGGTTNFLRADGTWAAPAGGGSGATQLKRSTSAQGPNNSTTKTALADYTFSAGQLVAGDMIEMKIVGLWRNDTGTTRQITVGIELGATTVFTASVTASPQTTERIFEINLCMWVDTTTAQRIKMVSFGAPVAPGASAVTNTSGSMPFNHLGYGTASEDLSASKTLQIAVTTPYAVTAGQNLYVLSQAYSVIKYPAP